MESFDSIYRGLSEHPTTAMLVLALLAIAFLVRHIFSLYAAHALTINELHKAHLESIMQTLPLGLKLAEAVESCERIISRVLNRQSGGDA